MTLGATAGSASTASPHSLASKVVPPPPLVAGPVPVATLVEPEPELELELELASSVGAPGSTKQPPSVAQRGKTVRTDSGPAMV